MNDLIFLKLCFGNTGMTLYIIDWLRATVVERWSLTGRAGLPCAKTTADGSPLI